MHFVLSLGLFWAYCNLDMSHGSSEASYDADITSKEALSHSSLRDQVLYSTYKHYISYKLLKNARKHSVALTKARTPSSTC